MDGMKYTKSSQKKYTFDRFFNAKYVGIIDTKKFLLDFIFTLNGGL